MMKQTGATLAITLILLFLVTLLGISSLQVTHLEEKMSSNLQDKELSFNAAESALSAGEAWIISQTTIPYEQSSCTSFPCVHSEYQNVDFSTQTSSWWTTNSATYSNTLTNINTPPRYIIEFLTFVPDTPEVGNSTQKSKGVYYYQVTARGTGSSDNAVTILQSTVARRF